MLDGSSPSQATDPVKFGDTLHRHQWRTKQNVDYAFLVWYSQGLSELYMQMEDDVQVVSGFLHKVDQFLQTLSDPWKMVAFSKLGFIGKLFKSEDLSRLADFLYAFRDQACGLSTQCAKPLLELCVLILRARATG